MLNQDILSSPPYKKAALAFIIFALLTGLSCGKRKPPLPPIESVQQRVVISGIQRGNVAVISWTLPDKNAPDKSTLNIKRADIYRLAEPLNAPLTLSEEEFASRSVLISTVPITDSDFARKQIIYTDNLEFAGQPARLRYAVRLVNDSDQKAAFSNFLIVEPTAKVAQNPTSLSAKLSENAVGLNWTNPLNNVDGSTPANILGFNIYRFESEVSNVKLLNNTPVTNNNFDDNSFEFGGNYTYFIRTISLGANGEAVESTDSNTIKVAPKDVFAPSPPNSLTIAAAPKNLSVFFAANDEKDVAGYKIYRTTNINQTKTDWRLLNEELLTANTFQDTNIESGKTYYYYLTAVDKTGNASEPSEIVSETAP